MAGIDPAIDPKGARWERRLRKPVLTAAWLAIPTVALYFSDLGPALAVVTVVMSWSIWVVFVGEAVLMLCVVADRRAWVRGHVFGLAIIIATFPLLTAILEGLLAARALSSIQGARVLQLLYLAKAAKLIKSLQIFRNVGGKPSNPLVWGSFSVVLAVLAVGIGHRIVTGEKSPTPVHGTWNIVDELPVWSLLVAAALLLALIAVALGGRRARAS